jgi:hypothetical protein
MSSIIKRGALLAGALLVVSLVAAVSPAAAGVPPTTGVLTATLTVTKVVQGVAPADAEFVIEVDCEDGTTELTFGPEGGSEDLTFFDEDVCTITEIETGGAVDVTPPFDIEIASPTFYEATVTNVFDTAPSSSTTASAQAAAATRPTFTG